MLLYSGHYRNRTVQLAVDFAFSPTAGCPELRPRSGTQCNLLPRLNFSVAVKKNAETFREVRTFYPRKYSVRPFQVLMESLIPYLTGNVHCACGDLMSNVDMPDEADGAAAAAYAQSIDRRGLKLKLGIADLLGLLSN